MIGPDPGQANRKRNKRQAAGMQGTYGQDGEAREVLLTKPATDLARAWAGHRYGAQALSPALEFICVAQKPYEGRPIDCIAQTGAGALNIDGSRIPGNPWTFGTQTDIRGGKYGSNRVREGNVFARNVKGGENGRWPSNLILQGAACAMVDRQSGLRSAGHSPAARGPSGYSGGWNGQASLAARKFDSGGASRYFFQVQEAIDAADPVIYQAKASTVEREAGLDTLPAVQRYEGVHDNPKRALQAERAMDTDETQPARNPHPTIKPIALARYLAGLLLPPGLYAPRRLVIPFAGVGSEMCGADLAGWEEVVGIEQSPEYCRIAELRRKFWRGNVGLFEHLLQGDEEEDAQQSLFE